MRRIPLNHGLAALVDDADFAVVNGIHWYAFRKLGERAWYAKSSRPVHRMMHQVIMKPPRGRVVDHINGNSLDNRRRNMRIATVGQNTRNKHKGRGAYHSKWKGVTWQKNAKKWQAGITPRGRYVYLGLFDSEDQAARVYDAAARREFGKFSRLNFPRRGEQSAAQPGVL